MKIPCKWGDKYCEKMTFDCIGKCAKWRAYLKAIETERKLLEKKIGEDQNKERI